jgi:hypothetical protein
MSMSGIYIPVVSLPGEGDFELWIAVRKDGSFTYNVRGGWQDGKQKAVRVPPHGRLIDADALKTKHHWTDDYYETEYVEVEDIDTAPTIIPAEPAEEETT